MALSKQFPFVKMECSEGQPKPPPSATMADDWCGADGRFSWVSVYALLLLLLEISWMQRHTLMPSILFLASNQQTDHLCPPHAHHGPCSHSHSSSSGGGSSGSSGSSSSSGSSGSSYQQDANGNTVDGDGNVVVQNYADGESGTATNRDGSTQAASRKTTAWWVAGAAMATTMIVGAVMWKRKVRTKRVLRWIACVALHSSLDKHAHLWTFVLVSCHIALYRKTKTKNKAWTMTWLDLYVKWWQAEEPLSLDRPLLRTMWRQRVQTLSHWMDRRAISRKLKWKRHLLAEHVIPSRVLPCNCQSTCCIMWLHPKNFSLLDISLGY